MAGACTAAAHSYSTADVNAAAGAHAAAGANAGSVVPSGSIGDFSAC